VSEYFLNGTSAQGEKEREREGKGKQGRGGIRGAYF